MKDLFNKVKDKLTGKKEKPGELTHKEMMAKEKGAKTFEVGGKTFNVQNK